MVMMMMVQWQIHAEGVAVVDAKISDSPIKLSRRHSKDRTSVSWCQTGWVLVVVVVAVLVAVGMGAYCGSTGNCGSCNNVRYQIHHLRRLPIRVARINHL